MIRLLRTVHDQWYPKQRPKYQHHSPHAQQRFIARVRGRLRYDVGFGAVRAHGDGGRISSQWRQFEVIVYSGLDWRGKGGHAVIDGHGSCRDQRRGGGLYIEVLVSCTLREQSHNISALRKNSFRFGNNISIAIALLRCL